MQKCLKCGFENADEAKYCINCGARTDGKINCPKCNEVIDPSVNHCPNCGVLIPHKRNMKKDNSFKEKITPVSKVFNKVFLIMSIVLFSLGFFAVFGQYLNNGLDGYAYSFIVTNWINFANNLPSMDVFNTTEEVTKLSFGSIVVLFNIAATFTFGIMGINKAAKALKERGKCFIYRELAIVYISNLLTASLLSSSFGYYASNMIDSYNGLLGFVFTAMVVFHIIETFDKNNISLLFEKICFALTFLFATTMISSLSSTVIYVQGVFFQPIELFNYFLAINFFANDLQIASFILSVGLVLIALLEYLVLCTLAIYFASGFFGEDERKMKYKIPCYVLSFSVSLLATIVLIISIVLRVVLSNAEPGWYIEFRQMAIVNYVVAMLLFGAAIASLTITRKYRRYEKLADQSTNKQ